MNGVEMNPQMNLEKRIEIQTVFEDIQGTFIKHSMIKQIIQTCFPSSRICKEYEFDPDRLHVYIKTMDFIHIFKSIFFNNFINRTSDIERTLQIAQHIIKDKEWMDSMFFMYFDINTKQFALYDGMHRAKSLEMIYDEFHKIESDVFFGNKDHLEKILNEEIIVHLVFNKDELWIRYKFSILNKNIPVNEFYISNISKEKKDFVEFICDYFQKKYKSHFSTTLHFYRPNTNRDTFIEFINQFMTLKNIQIHPDSKQIIIQMIENENENWKNIIVHKSKKIKKIPQNIIDKCLQTNCFLFIIKGFDHLLV
jgi:hypothetical protein